MRHNLAELLRDGIRRLEEDRLWDQPPKDHTAHTLAACETVGGTDPTLRQGLQAGPVAKPKRPTDGGDGEPHDAAHGDGRDIDLKAFLAPRRLSEL